MLATLNGLFTRKTGDYRRFLLRQLPPHSVGCELGVWKGDFSAEILKITQPKELYLVDPWLFQPEYPRSWYGGAAAQTQQDMDNIHQGVINRFAGRDNVHIIRKKTEQLADEISPSSLDWAYIDGNHQYEFVLQDLGMFDKLVKPGGIICGDDFDRGQAPPYPITQAVNEFVKRGSCRLIWVKQNQFFLRKLV